MRFLLFFVSFFYFFQSIALANDNSMTYQSSVFKRFQTNKEPKLKNFATHELKKYSEQTKAVFYPFGGPDIVYPATLFPKAQSYLLVGLEPVGNVNKDIVITKNLQEQLDSFLLRSFFVTADMGISLTKKEGVLQLFLRQIALLGGKVTDIKFTDRSFGKILEIDFTHLELEKKLIYVQTNVTDKNLSNDFIKFAKSIFDTCMLKASSYALHQNNFSKLRDFILSTANVILQDDTGVPINKLSPNFTLHLFGNYVQPYGKEWKGYFQHDLYTMYRKHKDAKSVLPFCYGYGCGKSPVAIILAIRNY